MFLLYFSHVPLAKQGDVGMVPHFVMWREATSKNWRRCRDKNKTRLSLSSGLLYSGDVYSSTDDQDTNCWQHLSQMERKAKPSLPNHSHSYKKANLYQTKSCQPSSNNLYTNHWQHLSQIDRKAKPVIAKSPKYFRQAVGLSGARKICDFLKVDVQVF